MSLRTVGLVAALAAGRLAAEPSAAEIGHGDLPATLANASMGATSGYSEREAVEFAYLSTAAYCSTGQLESWACGPACSHVPDMQDIRRVGSRDIAAHAFVGRLRGRCVLSFRGTDSVMGWGRNLMSLATVPYSGCGGCRVGAGFLDGYDAMAGKIRQRLSEIGCGKSAPLAVTGHSFGAVMATLAIFDLGSSGYQLTTSYTFGSPRVGNAAFASAFNSRFSRLPVFRVTRSDDPTVYVPFRGRFHHVGREVYYRGGTERGYRLCNGSGEDGACAGTKNSFQVGLMLLWCVNPYVCGHYRYMQPKKDGLMIRVCRNRKEQQEPLFP
mmetsp:Transcript_18679/g.53984  ORF Transcript_18679/g.53984 Transcript_18679/m.53984 type:complete len:326 (-) Transcript_18679:332-1309(-)